ncbi:hypothetical protein J5N97_018568 [Dioscorea zingiberensis]|uniref:Ammonium transporter AmtB-like domain-containing protein n=1 Tax=Dioscorea zingiberensis TaxID=325984 RepID=A0A9D5HBL8_9LILI|nr:hypothetical protein J5N97_018568 [Dioscorea zingiberensis]
MSTVVPVAYQGNTSAAVPDWLNKGDNAWQMISATLVGLQSVPGLVILYGSIVKKKWAVNSAFMALYAFAAVLLCWVIWAYNMSFGDKLLPLWGKAKPALGQKFLIKQAALPSTTHYHHDGTLETATIEPFYPMASMVYFQCVFAAITLILLAGSLLGRMNIKAWMLFVPLWLTFSYTVGFYQAGKESFRSFTRSYYRGAVGALLVYDMKRDVMEFRDMEFKAWARVQSLKFSLDEYNLELRVKEANEAEAEAQHRLATAEAEIADLRNP